MNIRYAFCSLVVGIILLFPIHGYAATFLIANDDNPDVVVPELEDDDVFAFGNIVDVSGGALQDVVAGGQSVIIGNTVGGDVYAAGQTVYVNAVVEDDLHAGGEVITILGTINGDVFAGGQSITFDKSVSIEEDVYVGGQNVVINGNIGGTVRVGADTVSIQDGTVIAGDLISYGNNKPTIHDGAVITGEIKHIPSPVPVRNRLAEWVSRVVTLFVIALLLAYVLPRFSEKVTALLRDKPWASLLTGAVWVVLLFPAVILLLITVIGIPLGFALVLFTFSVLLIAPGYAALVIGLWIMERITRDKEQLPFLWSHALLGAVVYETVQLIGPLGYVVTFVAMLFAFGAILSATWSLFRKASFKE